MKIVIDIDVNTYTRLFDNCKNNLYDMRAVCYAVRKGTIIPSGHGRLIDADELKVNMPTIEDEFKYAHKLIDRAETIIPADKEESE